MRIYLTANRLVETGKWIEIYANKTVSSKDRPQCTSIVRYWGPKELLDKLKKDLDNLPLDKLKRWYRSGLLGKTSEEISVIGKTHELVLGSADFPKDERLRPSTPEAGRRVYHRHWEIEEMYRYANRRITGTILFFSLIFFSVFALFVLLTSPSLTGLIVFTPSNAGAPILAILCAGFVSLLILLLVRSGFLKEKEY